MKSNHETQTGENMEKKYFVADLDGKVYGHVRGA
jgi:hypothetical protein